MSPTEKQIKGFVALLLGVFVLSEIHFAKAWVDEQGGIAGANRDLWNNILHSPLYQVTAIDFAGLASLIFPWMIWDSRRRQHPWRPWLWLPVFLFSPSLGAFGYLLTRRDSESQRVVDAKSTASASLSAGIGTD